MRALTRFHTELDSAAEAKQVLVYLGEQFTSLHADTYWFSCLVLDVYVLNSVTVLALLAVLSLFVTVLNQIHLKCNCLHIRDFRIVINDPVFIYP